MVETPRPVDDMAISVFNTLTRRKEPLAPIRPGEVGIYLCGPTVYDDCHIGHVAGPIMFDAVACWLRARDFRVRLVNNITDIDDKIINRSRETGEPWQAITRRYTDQYLGYLAQLKVSTISDHPRCSDYIPQMVAYIAELVRHDRAYVAADGVYFDIEKQAGYGKLSGRKLDEMIAGARIERDGGLRHPADFALWKLVKPGEPSWDSPWGAGRPGWHIECSVMSTALLGENFDIHAGGDDLKFPHHENEIAQAEAHSGCYANCWMHNGLLQYEGTKIGKSDPRMKDPEFRKQFRLDWILSSYGPSTVRFLILQGHYRRPSDFTSKQLEAQRKALGRLHRLLGPGMAEPGSPTLAEIERATASDPTLAPHLARFAEVMDDDFRTGDAIAELFTVAKLETPAALRLVRDLGRLLGLFQPGDEKDTQAETAAAGGAADQQVAALMELVLPLRQQVRLA
ncbi:MAG: cysteine--tRNA ligase, partial [Planctomycetes bacterium]|nr:cysteine--tRNA ligase [Planctomycetota bacterium]